MLWACIKGESCVTIIETYLTQLCKMRRYFKWAFELSRSIRPEVFCKKGVLGNFSKFTGKHLYQGFFFNKVAGLRPATLLKKRLWHRRFPVNFPKFLRTPFYRTPCDECFSIIQRLIWNSYEIPPNDCFWMSLWIISYIFNTGDNKTKDP